MKSVTELNGIGFGRKALIIATGHSYLDLDYNEVPNDMARFEINKMRVDTRIDYSMYYDNEWKNYFNENELMDNRQLIGFAPDGRETYPSKYTDYWFDTKIIPFSDSGFHCLYLVSEIMKFSEVYLTGYDYCKKGGTWHPYTDDFITDDLDSRKTKLLQDQCDKFKDIEWYAKIYNCNRESKLEGFPFGLPYKIKELINGS